MAKASTAQAKSVAPEESTPSVEAARSRARSNVFPPNYTFKVDHAKVDLHFKTYFLSGTDRRGLSRYVKQATKHFQQGFRIVLVGAPNLIEDKKEKEKLVGHVWGDHFFEAVTWAKSNVLEELHRNYLQSGGGTPEERQKALRAYEKAYEQLQVHLELVPQLQQELDRAAAGLVERFGRDAMEMRGATYDPSYAKEKVYWKRRGGKDFA